MISSGKCFKHKGLKVFWESGCANSKSLPFDSVRKISRILVHLRTAHSLNDIAEGMGKSLNFHKLVGCSNRYALSVTGNYRITFDSDSGGNITNIDYEDYH